MRVGELRQHLSGVPDDVDVSLLFGHSLCTIVKVEWCRHIGQMLIAIEEDQDLSDHEKHEG